MSSNSHNTVALGARTNIFDSETGEFDTERDPKDDSKPSHDGSDDGTVHDFATVDEMLGRGETHTQVQGVNRDAWVAGSILRSYGNPPIFCPECWHEFDTKSKLSDAEHYVPRIEVDHEFDTESLAHSLEISKNDHRRHRHCPECGAVSFGGVLGDRDTETFEEILEYVFDAVDELVLSRRRQLTAHALERKADGMSDESNMEHVVRDLRTADQ
ncbi:hypothetical protein [Natrinema pallidum]|uniref:Uncharacterized protein n=1 Tax=Natrinema pallidum TaxID=69527 RepID=A0A4P9TLX5_9EURY|nr:hypothetical protein [Natrinema pallidum]QCW05225.1 hypothetical protein FGF80_18415 [Natrinema pallidum]